MVKVKIDRKICIGCGACEAIANSIFIVPSGEKSLFKGKFYISENKKEYEISDSINMEDLEKISEEIGETIIEKEISEEEIEEVEMAIEGCPVDAIVIEKD